MHLQGREKRKFANDLISFGDSGVIFCNKSPHTPAGDTEMPEEQPIKVSWKNELRLMCI